MSQIEVHCVDCIELFGEDFLHVHQWLDQYAKDFPPVVWNDYHRSFLHNSYGVEIVKARWGYDAGMAAMIHLSRDFNDVALVNKLPEITDRALLWFNNLENMEAHVHPSTIRAWKGVSLVSLLSE